VEVGVERLAALVLTLTCLSHILVPAAWVRLFAAIRERGDLAGFATAAIHLPLGLMIVAFHEVWQWPEIVVTLIGWALLVKGSLHLLFPAVAQRSLALAGDGDQAVRRYRLAGIVMLPLALFVGWIALR
jgi:hypothetical protein